MADLWVPLRRRRILLLFAGFVTVLLLGTYFVLQHTGASRAIVQSLLARFIRSRLDLSGAEVDPASGKVRLRSLQIAHPRDAANPVLIADRIELDVSTNPLGADGVGSLRQVRIERLDLRLSLSGGQKWDLEEILHLPDDAPGAAGSCPPVVITDSRFSIRVAENAPEVVFTDVELELLPESPGSSRMALRGSMVSPAGFAVRVQGSGDLAKPELRALVESDAIPLAAETARPYSADAEVYLRDARFRAAARKVALWLQYPPEAGDDSAVSARLRAELEGVECVPREVPYPVRGATGSVTASTRDGGTLRFDLAVAGGGRSLGARGELTGLFTGSPMVDVRAHAAGVPVDADLEQALARLEESRRVWQAFVPRGGRADADLSLHSEQPGQPPALAMDLTLHEVSGSFDGFGDGVCFPYWIDDVSGLIQLRPGRIVLNDVRGQRADGGSVRVRGSLHGLGSPSAKQEIDLHVDGRKLSFSPELRAAVDAVIAGGAAYDQFAPEGSTDVEVEVRKARADPTADVLVVLRPLECSLSYAHFPYRVDRITGAIEIDAYGVGFDLRGRRGEGAIELGGRFLSRAPDASMESELWVRGQAIALDPELRRATCALDPGLDRFWSDLAPAGMVDCQLSLWRRLGSPAFDYDLRLDCLGGSVGLPALDRRLEGLSGSVFAHGTGDRLALDLAALRGELASGSAAPPARVLIEGTALRGGGGDALDVTTLVRGLDLNAALANSLDAAGALNFSTWEVMRPSGVVDLVNRSQLTPGAPSVAQTLRVELRGVRSDARFLPSAVTDLHGEVTIRDGVGSFGDVRGRIGGAEVIWTDGAFGRRGDRTFVDTTLSAERLVVDASFANLLTGPLRQTYLDRNVRGAVRIDRLHLRYEFPPEGDDFELDLDGDLATEELSLSLAAPIRELNGSWHVAAGHVTPAGGEVLCTAQGVSFDVLGHGCRDLEARLTATPEQIELSDVVLGLHGGRVHGLPGESRSITYAPDSGDFSARLAWEGLRLSEFLQATGQSANLTRGTISGWLDLTSRPRSRALVAAGVLDIADSRLGEVPAFTAIYSYLAPEKRPQFDGVHLEYGIRDDRIEVRDLVLTSPLLRVQGSGVIGLDGYVDIELSFPDLFAAAADWFILPRVLNMLTSQVVRFRIDGYLRSPRARPRWLFQERAERRPIPPIPSPRRHAAPRGF